MNIIKPRTVITVDVLYYLPDYPSIVEEFIWQTPDLWPEIPRIHEFLGYWHENIEATIEKVYVFHARDSWRQVDLEMLI
jgi:uncharacterized protein Usg